MPTSREIIDRKIAKDIPLTLTEFDKFEKRPITADSPSSVQVTDGRKIKVFSLVEHKRFKWSPEFARVTLEYTPPIDME